MTTVTVIIPAYNEGEAFGARLVSLVEYFAMHRGCGYDFRYVIVDDGSVDDTYAAAMSFARWRTNVRVLQHPANAGLGAALRTAFAVVDSEFAIVLDADLSYSPSTGMALLEALELDHADIALASAYMRGGAVVNVPPLRRFLSREANRLLSLASSGRYATFTCMVRAYRVSAMRQLAFHSDGMDAIAEMLLDALRKKLLVIEVPATLRWTDARRRMRNRLRLDRVVAQTWATLRLAFAYRPALWLAIPGLFPGLLPIVIAVLLLLHVHAAAFAAITTATIFVQYTSLAIFAGQVGSFAVRRSLKSRPNQPAGVKNHDYDIPTRIA